MATKVKPSRLQITGTPQAWNVPVYVDQDTFQRWAWWWGGWDVKVFKLQWTTDYTTADDARDAYMLWEPVIVMLGTDAFRFTSGTVLYWDIPTVFSASWITTKMMVLTLDWNNKVTNIQVTNMSFSWPTVVDNLTTQSATSALSANQWYVLKTLVDNLTSRGRFLSLWNSATWLAVSNPQSFPYTYKTWDYFIVWVTSSATPPVNYRPDGNSYTGTASTVVETEEVEVWDTYAYDGTNWLLQSNHWKTVTFANITWDAMDNVSLSWYLNTKAFYLSSASDLTTAQAAYDWYLAGKNPIIVYNSVSYRVYSATSSKFSLKGEIGVTNSINSTELAPNVISINISNGSVTTISTSIDGAARIRVLDTTVNYNTPYTPLYNWSPATKKYVDDNIEDVVIDLPSVADDEREIYAALATWKWVTFKSGDNYYKVRKFVDNAPTDFIVYASNWSDWQDYTTWYTIVWELGNWITSVTSYTKNYFTPTSAGTTWQILEKTVAWYNWTDQAIKSFTYPSVSDNIISLHDWVRVWKPAVLLETNWAAKIVYVVDKFVDRALWWDDDMIYASAITDAWVISVLIRVNYVDSTTATVTSVTASSVGWWLQVSPNSTITGIKYVWYGTESDYANLAQYYTDTPWDTEFHTF